jgi:hypothetical protein
MDAKRNPVRRGEEVSGPTLARSHEPEIEWREYPRAAQMVAAKAQSLSEILFLSASEVSNPDHSKILQEHGQFTETLFRSLRWIARASEGGHRE